MMNNEPRITLLSWTQFPLETVYSVWMASKDDEPLMLPEEVREKVPAEEVEKLFKAVIAQRIPIGEHIDFVFLIENVSISWREQAVRHRIGTLISPERMGLDIIPDLASSSWWSQSHRIRKVDKFAVNGEYRLPKTIVDAGEMASDIYQDTIYAIQRAYSKLIELGIPMEDARELLPLGAHHRISWKLNIGSLQHIVGKRSCFILQLGIWGPVIMGMIEELVNKVNPIFADLVKPPCIGDDDKFKECIYMEECQRRLDGDDELPPCPLHLAKHHYFDGQGDYVDSMVDLGGLATADNINMWKEMIDRAVQYRKFWRRNPATGEKI